jgi:hypothetical protein
MPGTVARRLYSQLLRLNRTFARERIPAVGIVGSTDPPHLDLRSALAAAFRLPASGPVATERLDEGFRALRQGHHQLQVLQATEEEARTVRTPVQLAEVLDGAVPVPQSVEGCPLQALGSWAGLASHWGPRWQLPQSSSNAARTGDAPVGAAHGNSQLKLLAAAVEDGLLLLDRLHEANHTPLEYGDTEAAEPEAADGAGTGAPGWEGRGAPECTGPPLPDPMLSQATARARRQLDRLAAHVAAEQPGLFPSASSPGAAPSAPDGALLRRQVEAINEVRSWASCCRGWH